VPAVLAEKGCIRYEPTLDIDSGLPPQGAPRADAITLLESWESLPALLAHLKTPHMAAYRDKVKGLVKQVRLNVMAPA
jgi:quinol monooxygenase YgiN